MGRASQRVDSKYKDIVNLLERLSGSKSMWQVFSDCVECMALAISNSVDHSNFDRREKTYKAIISGYSEEEVNRMAEFSAKIIQAFEDRPFQDFFSALFMSLDMGSDALGQVFTPWSVCGLMPRVSMDADKIKKEIAEKGYIKLAEPSCGGGATIIGALDYLHEQGIDYQKNVIIICQDLSRVAALQCYISLSLLGASAVIKIGDTICDPYTNYAAERAKGSELWITPMCIWSGNFVKC